MKINSEIVKVCGVTAIILFSFIALIESLDLFGVFSGFIVWGGAFEIVTSQIYGGAFLAIVLPAFFAYVIWVRADLSRTIISSGFHSVASWAITVLMLLYSFGNYIPANTIEMIVFIATVVLFVCCLIVSLSKK